ncbi:hypothetical protein EIP91_006846 [Steccherinum ochraceum]|uniref:Zn(2)-C6 fungal-type domain-containing protein n=1 Tax=Steccherinum ochraceum TaxID=92696 RepID=A0A4R0RM23_9APHY|nr:hypothetical protein EIP91_006846 [Steccherinum ochraceum]
MSGASTSASAASSPSVPLERGKACLRCRRRKMRCDGVRPMCAQCVRADEVECEYTDGGATVSQLLEQNVAHLEARIRELEGRSSESITLHDPHAAFSQARNRSSAAGAVTGGERGHTSLGRWQIPEAVLASFVSHAFAFGFFLNMPRFLAKLGTTSGENSVPPVLLYVVHLVGLVTLQEPQLKEQEPHILSYLTQALSAAVSNVQSGMLLYLLQAEVLLSNYFFHHDRRLEGGYHITAAVSIVLSTNLHQFDWSGAAQPASGAYHLPHPADTVEQGERINAFWTVFNLDRCWAVSLGSQSALARIDLLSSHILTPWPLDMSDYELGLLPEILPGQTVPSFLSQTTIEITSDSRNSQRTKAVVLFSEAVALAKHFAPQNPAYQARFVALDNKLEQYKQSLFQVWAMARATSVPGGQLGGDAVRPYATRCILFTRTLVHCAAIKLHAPLQQDWDLTTSRTLSNAVQAADLLQDLDVMTVGSVDPFTGILLSIVAQVLIRALAVAKTLRTASATARPSEQELIVANALERVYSVMQALTATNPSAELIAHELRNIRQQHIMFQTP